jgi:hypothetical protein
MAAGARSGADVGDWPVRLISIVNDRFPLLAIVNDRQRS